MRKFGIAIFVSLTVASISASAAYAATTLSKAPSLTPAPKRATGLAAVCSKIKPFQNKVLYKYQASGHLQGTTRARSCSLIVGKGNNTYPRIRHLRMYDIKGKYLDTFVNYAMNGKIYAARWYTPGNPSCSQVAATAYKRTRSYAAYVAIGNKTCWKVNDLRGRQGGVM